MYRCLTKSINLQYTFLISEQEESADEIREKLLLSGVIELLDLT